MTFYKYPPIEKQLENLNNGIYRYFEHLKQPSQLGRAQSTFMAKDRNRPDPMRIYNENGC